MDFTFLKQRYDFELERRDRLTASVSLPAGFLTALGSVMALMARGFSYENHALTNVFVLALVLGACSLVISVVYLSWSYPSWKYEQLPPLGNLRTIEHDLGRFHQSLGRTAGDAAEMFDVELRRRVIAAADWNTSRNELRARTIHRANAAMLAVLLFTAIAGMAYIADQSRRIHMSKSASGSERLPSSMSPEEWRTSQLTWSERVRDWVGVHMFGFEPVYVHPQIDPPTDGRPQWPENLRFSQWEGPPPYVPPPEPPEFIEGTTIRRPKNVRI